MIKPTPKPNIKKEVPDMYPPEESQMPERDRTVDVQESDMVSVLIPRDQYESLVKMIGMLNDAMAETPVDNLPLIEEEGDDPNASPAKPDMSEVRKMAKAAGESLMM